MNDDRKVPFFVRYLEAQQDEQLEVKTDVKAGKPEQTMKAPSDRDEI
jgi:HAMP domain-containing protein